MTPQGRLKKHGIYIGLVVFYVLFYLFCNWLTERRQFHLSLALPLERHIPFVPQFIFGYLLIYVFAALPYLCIDDFPLFKVFGKVFLINSIFHFLFFLGLPVRYSLRPSIPLDSSALLNFIHYYYWADLPNNCFPSLHVSTVFLIVFFMHRVDRRWTYGLLPLAWLVAFSVLFVKQHYVIDVLGGVFVALGSYRWVCQAWPLKAIKLPASPSRASPPVG